MKPSETQNMMVMFILGAVGTMAAIWSLFASYREGSELRAYLRFSRL